MKSPRYCLLGKLKSFIVVSILVGGIIPQAFGGAANIDQGANGTPALPTSPVEWVNGNVNASKAHYVEGYSVAYRAVITGVSTGAHNLKIEWDIRKSGKAGLDYITHYNRLQPHNQFGSHITAESIDPLVDQSNILNTNTFPIPAPSSAGSIVPGQPTTS